MSDQRNAPGLRERRPGVWEARVGWRDAQGRSHEYTETVYTGKRDAQKALAKLRAKRDAGNNAAGDMTVEQLLEEFIETRKTLGRSPRTVENYRSVAKNHLCPGLGRIKLDDLKATHLDHLYAKLVARGLKATTIQNVHITIGAALNQAKKYRYVDRNVALDASPPPGSSPEVTVPTADEVRRVIDAAELVNPSRAHLLFFAVLTGARDGELCGLRWSDVDWEDATLAIVRRVLLVRGKGLEVHRGTKNGKTRRIGLSDGSLILLRRQRALVDRRAETMGETVSDDAYIFSESPAGLTPLGPNALSCFTRNTARRAGVKTHLHALRHFSSTQGYAAGFDAPTVAARHGHSPQESLRTYAHVIEPRARDLAANADRAMALPAEWGLPPMLALPAASETTTT